MGDLREVAAVGSRPVRLIVAISGRTASGKTTFAEALSECLNGVPVSFGDHVRTLAREQGRGGDRETLQRIGQEEVARDPEGFVRAVLSRRPTPEGGTLVVEGLRHVVVRDVLRRLARSEGADLWFVHVTVGEGERQRRLNARGETAEMTSRLDAHPSEADVGELLAEGADIVLPPSDDPDRMSAVVAGIIRSRPSGPDHQRQHQ